ncbi:MAG: winged helix-turn-helix transcriptional regulator [Peptostreptococcaceae bacterium]
MIVIEKKLVTYPIELVLLLLGDKWSFLIICKLRKGTMRFNELKKSIDNISTKMLTQQLQKLELHGFVSRKVYAEVPPRVEYSLTNRGHSLETIMKSMFDWGMDNKELFTEHFEITIDPNLEFPYYK